MNELFKKDITIKIVSVLFALALWFAVNPVNTRDFTISLNVINENVLKEKNLELRNRNFSRTIQVRVRGREDRLSKINERDFEATLDFSQIDSASDNMIAITPPVYKGKVQGVKIEQYWPKNIDIGLERVISKSFTVGIEQPKGKLKPGYKVISMKVNPEKVELRDIESVIKQIDKVKVDVDLNNIKESMAIQSNCKVYDKRGREIPQLSKNCNVEVIVEIAKEVPVTVEKKDELPSGYIGGIARITPDKVLITGPANILDKITELRTQPISLSGINKNTDITATLVMPEGVKLVNPQQKIIANVTVEPLVEKSITLSKEDISLLNMDVGMDYTIQTQEVNIKLKGLQKDLNTVNTSALKPEVNVAELGEGTNKVPVSFATIGNVKLLGSYEIEVLVQKKVEIQ